MKENATPNETSKESNQLEFSSVRKILSRFPIKALVIVIIAVTLLNVSLLSITAYFAFFKEKPPPVENINTPTPLTTPTDPTADWKIYRNEEYGFEFKYQPYLSISSQSEGSVIWNAEYNPGEIVNEHLVLTTQNTPFEEIVGSQQMTLGGKKVRKVEFGCGIDCYFVGMQFFSRGRYFELKQDAAGGGLLGDFDQILSTFRFIEQNSNHNTTSNWRSLTNNTLGFTLQYPESLIIQPTAPNQVLITTPDYAVDHSSAVNPDANKGGSMHISAGSGNFGQYQADCLKKADCSVTKISGYDGLVTTFKSSNFAAAKEVVISSGNKVIVIIIGIAKSANPSFLTLADQILSTFRFVDGKTPTESASSPCPPGIDINIPC